MDTAEEGKSAAPAPLLWRPGSGRARARSAALEAGGGRSGGGASAWGGRVGTAARPGGRDEALGPFARRAAGSRGGREQEVTPWRPRPFLAGARARSAGPLPGPGASGCGGRGRRGSPPPLSRQSRVVGGTAPWSLHEVWGRFPRPSPLGFVFLYVALPLALRARPFHDKTSLLTETSRKIPRQVTAWWSDSVFKNLALCLRGP